MSQHCCIPGCNSIQINKGLCRVPSKKFCSGEKYIWAEKLERCILGLRADSGIKQLYKKDQVKICLKHFPTQDTETRGTRTYLKIGAFPVFHLPKKSIESYISRRPPPLKRKRLDIIYHRNLDEVKKSAKRYLPKGWEYDLTRDENALFFESPEQCLNTPRIAIRIGNDLSIAAFYYGWSVSGNLLLSNIDVPTVTLSNILATIASFTTCEGLVSDKDLHANDSTCIPHHRISCDFISGKGPPNMKLVATRSENCDIFINSGMKCTNCKRKEKILMTSEIKREKYQKKFGNLPLKKVKPLSLNSRKEATIKMKNQRLKELEKQVQRMLADTNSQVSTNPDISGDLNILIENGLLKKNVSPFYDLFWKEQMKLNSAAKHGKRYHPELIKFCSSLAMKSSSAYEELRQSGILTLPSKRTLLQYRNSNNSIKDHTLKCSSLLDSRDNYPTSFVSANDQHLDSIHETTFRVDVLNAESAVSTLSKQNVTGQVSDKPLTLSPLSSSPLDSETEEYCVTGNDLNIKIENQIPNLIEGEGAVKPLQGNDADLVQSTSIDEDISNDVKYILESITPQMTFKEYD